MSRCLWVGVVGALLPVAAQGQMSALFEDGISFDMDELTLMYGFWGSPNLDRRNVELSAYNGGLYLRGWKQETARGRFDGGVSVFGNPISLVLADDDGNNHGSFSVWSGTKYASTGADKPFFQIDGDMNTAAFNGVAVTVTSGSLSVAGSPVVTSGSSFNTALALSNPPISAAWSSTYLRKGNATNGGALASGLASASGTSSVAHGPSQTVASGPYSHAAGFRAIASGGSASAIGSDARAAGSYSTAQGTQANAYGEYSFARGYYSFANGDFSAASGFYSNANSYGETVFGRYNGVDSSSSPADWVDTDALFRIGNGSDSAASERSDAVTVRKNGETTLTNKAWKDYGLGLEETTVPGAAGGKALVVDGHTQLNGKVTIAAPQGDISMGIYQ